MTFQRALRLAAAAGLLAASTACVTYRGPRGIESAIEEQMGTSLEREFGLKLGWTTTKLAGAIVAHEDDEDTLAVKDLTGVGVAVFKVPEGASHVAGLDPARLHLGSFETLLNVRDRDGQVLVLAKTRHNSIHEVVFVSCDDEEVVVARRRGDLDRLGEHRTRAADEDGVRGARRAVPVASR
jgi:hypothetical protein